MMFDQRAPSIADWCPFADRRFIPSVHRAMAAQRKFQHRLTLSLLVAMSLSGAARAQPAMPAVQQDELVARYCAVCHSDRLANGGLSLQHFQAREAEPSLAALMARKLQTGAIHAAGIAVPDEQTQAGFLAALLAGAKGAEAWTLRHYVDPATQAPTLSLNRMVSVAQQRDSANLYRINVTCRTDTGAAQMQVTWSSAAAEPKRVISVSWDGQAPQAYRLGAAEQMGVGGTSGRASVMLSGATAETEGAKPKTVLAARSLTVTNVFDGPSVTFPFSGIPTAGREEMTRCLNKQQAQN